MVPPNAQTAIKILSQLQAKTSTASVAYWVTPNTILTLSGARAYCDGVFYNDSKMVLKKWIKEIADSIEVIKSITEVYFASAKVDKTVSEEDYASYDVVISQGLKYVFEHTNLLSSEKNDLIAQNLTGKKLMISMCALLKKNGGLKHFNNETLNHIAFGILVGYPDKAILGSVTEWEQDDPFAEPLIDADIRGASYYICPRPTYSYPRYLVTDTIIKAHEELWSSILKDFYTSDFHTSLAKDVQFQKKAKELGLNR